MGKRLSDSQRVLRYVAAADIAEVRQTLDLARVVVQAREGVGDKRKPRKAKAETTTQTVSGIPAQPYTV